MSRTRADLDSLVREVGATQPRPAGGGRQAGRRGSWARTRRRQALGLTKDPQQALPGRSAFMSGPVSGKTATPAGLGRRQKWLLLQAWGLRR